MISLLILLLKVKKTLGLGNDFTMNDLSEELNKLPIIPKRGFTLPNMHFCGPFNPLHKQLIYDQKGNIMRYIQKPTRKTDEILVNMMLIIV